MSTGYDPSTHFTCANCGKKQHRTQAAKGKLVCRNRKGCIDRTAARFAGLPAFPAQRSVVG